MPIQLPTVQKGFEASVNDARRKIGTIQINAELDSKSLKSLSQPLGKITGQADQFTKSMEAANARVLAFGASVGVLAAVSKGFKGIITTTIEVEKSLTSINSILGANAVQLGKFKNDIFNIARETGSSFQTVSEAALELSRQGLETDEVLRRLKDSMILSRLSGLSAAASVEGLTAAVNSFSKEGLTTSQVLNRISKTAAGFAVSERDLIEGFKRSASVAQQAGVSINELGGIITAVQQKTARGGAVIGNSFKTIFTRIQRQSSLQLLQDIGADITDAEGKLLTGTQLLGNLAEKLDSLNEIQLASVTEKIGGGFQIAPLIAALDDLNSKTSIYKEATKTMASASSEAYARNAVQNLTMSAAINEANVNLQELANTLGEIGVTDSLKNLLSYFNSFAENVKDVLQGEGIGSDMAKGLIKGISAVISGPGLWIFGAIILKLTANFAQFGVQALKTFFNIGAAAREIGSIQTTIASTLLNNKNIQTQILALEGNRAAQAQFFSTALNSQLATMEKMRSIAASIAPVVYGATTGSRRPKAAEGYMPTVMAEAGDIKKGVGGARPSDRPVVIPNFAFGGGKTGTMVAHTGEYIVPNFASGGSAIFNRDMVKTMGLPEGARKIGAAGGFIPNFASLKPDLAASRMALMDDEETKILDDYKKNYAQATFYTALKGDGAKLEKGLVRAGYDSVKVASIIGKVKADVGKAASTTLQLDAEAFGGLGLVSVTGATGGTATAKAKLDKSEKDIIDSYAVKGKTTDFTHASMSNILTRSLPNFSKDQKDNQKAFRQKTRDIFVDPLFELAEALMPGVFKNNKESERRSHLKKESSDPYLFSDSVLGGIFEAAIAVSTKSIKNLRSFNEENQKAPFDFEAAGGATKAFREAFQFPADAKESPIFKAEAKKTQRSDTLGDIVGKAIRDQNLQDMGVAKQAVRNQSIRPKAAGGYIPNFADPLNEAISREMSAGIPASQIYIDQNSSLKGPMNPTGLMVANRRDEPAGGFQGINRARKEGVDARLYGAAGGFVPNYADLTMAGIGSGSKNLAASLGALNTKIKELNVAIAENKITYERGTVELNEFIGGIDKIKPSTRVKTLKAAEGSLVKPDAVEKAPRDMLGTIFAVQAGLSLLTGATSDATSSFAKYTNITASSLGTATSTLFAFQGLSSAIPKFAGFLGPAGIAVSAVTGAYQLGTGILNEYFGINKIVSQSLHEVSKAAGEASVSLANLDPEAKERVEKESKAILAAGLKTGRTLQSVNLSGAFGVTTTTVDEIARFEKDVTGELAKSALDSITQAKGAGVSSDAITEALKAISEDAVITLNEARDLPKILANLMRELNKNAKGVSKILDESKDPDMEKAKAALAAMEPEEISKRAGTLGTTLAERAVFAGASAVTVGPFKNEADREKQLIASYKGKDSDFKFINAGDPTTDPTGFLRKIIADKTKLTGEALNKKTEEEALRIREKAATVAEIEKDERKAAQIEFEKYLRQLRSEANLRTNTAVLEGNITAERKTANEEILRIASDIDLTEKARKEQIEDANRALEIGVKKLENQEKAANELQTALAGAFGKSTLGADAQVNKINELFNTVKNLTEENLNTIVNQSLLGESSQAKALFTGVDDAVIASIIKYIVETEKAKKETLAANEADKEKIKQERLLADATKETTDSLTKRNQLLQTSIDLRKAFRELEIASYSDTEFAARKTVSSLGQPILGETSLQSLRREAEAARIQRELLTPIDQSRKIAEIENQQFQQAKTEVSSELLRGADPKEIETIKKSLEEITNFDELRIRYAKDLDGNLQLIEDQYNQRIAQQLKENDIAEQGLSIAEQRLNLIERGAAGGLQSGLDKLKDENEMFAFNLGERIPSLFADNMALAMEGVIMQGEKLSDSLRNAATSFLNEITKANIKNLASNFTTGGASGGSSIISSIGQALFRAKGGPITGGSGTKDDVPAMLMSGEYVINKKSVSKYGTAFMEALNSGSINGYAKGGSVIRGRGLGSDVVGNDAPQQTGQGGFQMPGYFGSGAITGKQNLLAFASQAYTSGERDIIQGGDNFASIDLTPESVRLTNFGRNQGPMAAAVKESKQQAFGLYVQQIEAEQRAKEEEKARKKEFRRALLMAAITTVGSAGLSYAGNVIGTGFQQGMSKTGTFMGGVKGVGEKVGNVGSGLGSLFSGDFKGASQQFKQATQFAGMPKATIVGGTDGVPFGSGGSLGKVASNFNPNRYLDQFDPVYPSMPQNYGDNYPSGLNIDPLSFKFGVDRNYMLQDALQRAFEKGRGINNEGFELLLPGFATGGRIPQTSGIDTVPAMLSGGEFIMNAGATQRIGANNLNALNSGATTTTDSSANNEELIRKLDELIKITKESGKPVTVNVSSAQTQSGGEEQGGDSQQKDQNLSRKIKEAVVRVLQEEKRLGGVLRRA